MYQRSDATRVSHTQLLHMTTFTGERHSGIHCYFWPGQAVSEMAFQGKKRRHGLSAPETG